MVTQFTKNFAAIFCAVALTFALGCNIDFLGLFAASSDLDDRLKERDNFTFIDEYATRSLNIGDSYSFFVIADTHIKAGNAHGLERMIDAITPDIKFVVILGDITEYGSRKDLLKFIEFAELLRERGVHIYPVIGNHDIYFDNFSHWRELIGSTSYRIDGDEIVLFIIDSANSFFGDDQLTWLDDQLDRNRKRDVFIFTHANLFAENPLDTRQVVDVRERARIVSILRDRADIMFMGHLHKNFTHTAGNVRYISIDEFKDWKTYCVVTVTSGEINYDIRELF